MKNLGLLTLGISCLVGLGLLAYGTVYSIRFEQQCEGFLKRAADANTVALARQELSKAVSFIESAHLNSGSTHAFYATPKCDLGFWYDNLKASLDELDSLPSDADALTKSNLLLKLRETIMDTGEKGTRVTTPPSIEIYPNQFAFRTAGFASLLGLVAGVLMLAVGCEAQKKCTDRKNLTASQC